MPFHLSLTIKIPAARNSKIGLTETFFGIIKGPPFAIVMRVCYSQYHDNKSGSNRAC